MWPGTSSLLLDLQTDYLISQLHKITFIPSISHKSVMNSLNFCHESTQQSNTFWFLPLIYSTKYLNCFSIGNFQNQPKCLITHLFINTFNKNAIVGVPYSLES